VQLFLLGEGPAEARLKTLCRKLGLSNVFFGPWVPQEHLLHYIAHAHLGVIPYSGSTLLNNRYCTPNKLFEFIEAEIPICASDLPELRRIVAGHGIGAVYPMEDVTAIAHAIEACRVRCLRGDFALSARHAARQRFSWERQEARLLELYERLGV
jgi:glycosyltransferase involved in cell wall biosynthesis